MRVLRDRRNDGHRAQARIISIQILRAVAILLVACWHSALILGGHEAVDAPFRSISPPLRFGFAGVDIFFVISGYICCLVAARGETRPGEFLRRRVVRILPFNILFSIPFVGLALLVPTMGHGRMDSAYVLSSLLCLPDPFLVAGADPRPFIPSGWSLQNEVLFYGLFALTLARSRKTLVAILLLLFAGGVVLHVAAFELLGWRINDLKIFSLYHLEFAAGVAIYLADIRIARIHPGVWALVAGLALGVTSATLVRLGPVDGSVPVTPFGWFGLVRVTGFALAGGALLACALTSEAWLQAHRTAILIRFAILVGEASYIFYLIHEMVFGAVGRLALHFGRQDGLLVPLTLLATLGLAVVLHLFLERPVIRYLEPFAARSRTVVAQ